MLHRFSRSGQRCTAPTWHTCRAPWMRRRSGPATSSSSTAAWHRGARCAELDLMLRVACAVEGGSCCSEQQVSHAARDHSLRLLPSGSTRADPKHPACAYIDRHVRFAVVHRRKAGLVGAAADDDEDDELFAPFKKQLHEQVRCVHSDAGRPPRRSAALCARLLCV